jgi:hypothetical protein
VVSYILSREEAELEEKENIRLGENSQEAGGSGKSWVDGWGGSRESQGKQSL